MRNRAEELEPLLVKYGRERHPLNYGNRYQLIVMIVLSAQTTDKLVNSIAPAFFEKYPSVRELAAAHPEELYPLISKVRGYMKKAAWLVQIANMAGSDEGIPASMNELTKFPGIGRKSANIIIRESGAPAEGVMVDLHVARVAPRIGIAQSDKPDRIEKEIMAALPREK